MDKEQLYKYIIHKSTMTRVTFIPTEITKITDYVYLGNYRNIYQLPENTMFKYIVNVSLLNYTLKIKGITLIHVPIADNATFNIHKQLDIVTSILEKCEKNKLPVLVHCMAGINRSAAMIMSYLLKNRDRNIPFVIYFLYIYHELKSIRGAFLENKSFVTQIIEHYL